MSVLVLFALGPILAHADDIQEIPPPPGSPNVNWNVQLAVGTCPAGDSVASAPSQIRIIVEYRNLEFDPKVDVPPESIWIRPSVTSGNLVLNNQRSLRGTDLVIYADDSTDTNGRTRFTLRSLSGCGTLRVELFVSGAYKKTATITVRTVDTNGDGRITSVDESSPCDINYDGQANDLQFVQAHLAHWHRLALIGTLVRRTNYCPTCDAFEPTSLGDSELSWSPEGKYVAHSYSDEQGHCQIYYVPSDPKDGDALRKFTFPVGGDHDYDPSWSPLGTEIVFDRNVTTVYRKGIPGLSPDTTERVVTSWDDGASPPRGDNTPAISPDGLWVVFSRRTVPQGPFQLFKVPITGGTPTQLTSDASGVDFYPQWSPDGQWIYYQRRVGNNKEELYKAPSGGGAKVRVYTATAPADTDAITPQLSADGKVLVAGVGGPRTAAHDWFLLVGPPGSSLEPSSLRRASLGEKPVVLPTAFALWQNQPNPFARTTTIRFELPVAAPVRLEVFDPQGRLVRTLAEGSFPVGFHAVEWGLSFAARPPAGGGGVPLPHRGGGVPRPEEDGAAAVAPTRRQARGRALEGARPAIRGSCRSVTSGRVIPAPAPVLKNPDG